LANPQLDLTQRFSRIPFAFDPSLCLDVFEGNPGAGAQVDIAGCNGTAAQNWTYDRANATIVNPSFNLCLDVIGRSLAAGTFVQTWFCNGTDAQKWTYDPETQRLQNAVNTILGVGSPVEPAPASAADRTSFGFFWWSNDACAHDICQTGGPLGADCDPCAGILSQQDGFCTSEEWDARCVDEARSACGVFCR